MCGLWRIIFFFFMFVGWLTKRKPFFLGFSVKHDHKIKTLMTSNKISQDNFVRLVRGWENFGSSNIQQCKYECVFVYAAGWVALGVGSSSRHGLMPYYRGLAEQHSNATLYSLFLYVCSPMTYQLITHSPQSTFYCGAATTSTRGYTGMPVY